MRLYRGTSDTDPYMGRGSNWSDSEEIALGFGGFRVPSNEGLALYAADVSPASLLDLRVPDPWDEYLAQIGVDLSEIDALRHAIIRSQVEAAASAGFDWLARYADMGPNLGAPHRAGGPEEWIYLGTGAVPATKVRSLPNW